MVAQLARDYEGRVLFVTSPGQDGQRAMREFVKEFKWPGSMVHAVDTDGALFGSISRSGIAEPGSSLTRTAQSSTKARLTSPNAMLEPTSTAL